MKIYSFCHEEKQKSSDREIVSAVRAYIGDENAQISVVRDEYGKPRVLGCENIYVSVTHAEKLLLVAVSGKEIGIDAEKNGRNVRNYKALTKRYFTKEETDFLSESFTKDDFLDMWVKKEALSKLFGKGIPCMKSTSVFDENISFSKHSEYENFIVYSVEFREQ